MSTAYDVASEMRSLAASMESRAKRLRDLADNIANADADEDQIDTQVGSEYSGPSWAVQITEEVNEALHSRPGETWAFSNAMIKYLATQQRREAGKGDA